LKAITANNKQNQRRNDAQKPKKKKKCKLFSLRQAICVVVAVAFAVAKYRFTSHN
jgi:hypothetical protein